LVAVGVLLVFLIRKYALRKNASASSTPSVNTVFHSQTESQLFQAEVELVHLPNPASLVDNPQYKPSEYHGKNSAEDDTEWEDIEGEEEFSKNAEAQVQTAQRQLPRVPFLPFYRNLSAPSASHPPKSRIYELDL
jgi:hypothetical protein